MSLAISAFAPEPIFTRRAHRQNMARAAKAFSAISLGAAFVLTTGEAGAQSARASAEDGFSPISGTPLGFNDDGDLIMTLSNGQEINAGAARGGAGVNGQPGAEGQHGADGQPGLAGDPGLSVASADIDDDGNSAMPVTSALQKQAPKVSGTRPPESYRVAKRDKL